MERDGLLRGSQIKMWEGGVRKTDIEAPGSEPFHIWGAFQVLGSVVRIAWPGLLSGRPQCLSQTVNSQEHTARRRAQRAAYTVPTHWHEWPEVRMANSMVIGLSNLHSNAKYLIVSNNIRGTPHSTALHAAMSLDTVIEG